MNPQVQRISTWMGLVGVLVVFVGLMVAGWFPPPHPDMTTSEVVRMYADSGSRISGGALIIALGGALTIGIVAAISSQIKRIEGSNGPLSSIQLGTGAVGILLFTVPGFFWVTAAYRPETGQEITARLNDAGWLSFLIAVFPAIIQSVVIAVACFTDGRPKPVFPRWLGYFQIWVALAFLPSVLVVFFKSGPFAWNGIFTFWLAAGAFGVWVVVMVRCLLSAINSQAAEEQLREAAATA
jgi:hypothetical protein